MLGDFSRERLQSFLFLKVSLFFIFVNYSKCPLMDSVNVILDFGCSSSILMDSEQTET